MQVVEVTGNRTAAIEDLSTKIAGAATQDLARTPFLLIGSHEEMAAQILSQAAELGITRYVIREAAVPALERVLDLIASPSRLPPPAGHPACLIPFDGNALRSHTAHLPL